MPIFPNNAVSLYDADGNSISVLGGSILSSGQPLIAIAGQDITSTARPLLVNSSGKPLVVADQGAPATAANAWPTKISDGTDTVGISTVSGAKALKVDVIQTTGGAGGTSSSYGAPFPATGTGAGFNDGTSNMQGARVYDVDTGVGTEYVLGVNLRQASAGGSIEFGTATNPLNVFITSPPSATTQLIRFGKRTTSALGEVPVRFTTYTEPTTAAQRSISSSSASDTAAGTGARSVKITYFSGTLAGPFTETIILNGTIPVNTVATDIRFIEKIELVTVGSTGSNVGVLTLFGSTGGGGGTIGTIAAGDRQTFWAHHYVPVGKTMQLRTFYAGVRGGNQGAGFFGRSINPLLANDVELQVTDELRAPAGASSVVRPYDSPIQVVGPARFTISVLPEGSNTLTWHASFDIVEL